jgi:hypothetical protein
MQRRVLGLGGLVAAAMLAAVMWWPHHGSTLPRVTETEARNSLTQIVAAGQAKDFTKLCSFNGAVNNCRRQLELVGTDAAPSDPPLVVGSRFHERSAPDDTPTYVLIVEGVDGRGKPYHTEVGVFWEERGVLKAINAVYWSNFKVTGPSDATSPG